MTEFFENADMDVKIIAIGTGLVVAMFVGCVFFVLKYKPKSSVS